jgi:hypothetical protein
VIRRVFVPGCAVAGAVVPRDRARAAVVGIVDIARDAYSGEGLEDLQRFTLLCALRNIGKAEA